MTGLTSAVLGLATLTQPITDHFIENIHSKVIEVIKNSDIPGLNSNEFESVKDKLIPCWNQLVEKGVIEIKETDTEVSIGEITVQNTDKEIRPIFVGLQTILEHVLSNELKAKNIKSLAGVIHTPMPATPLCTEDNISENLVDSSIKESPKRLLTVVARTKSIRKFLQEGGDLYVVYPKDGLSKRSELQQGVYNKELDRNKAHLFDCPLDCESIPQESIGAFYKFDGYAFAIKITQAKNPQDGAHCALWFGKANTSPVQDKITSVMGTIRNSKPKINLPF